MKILLIVKLYQDAENRQELFREFHRVIAPVVVMKKYDEDKS